MARMQRTYQLSEIAPTRAEGKLAELLLRAGTVRRFAAGAIVQQKGDDGDGFWLIRSGTVSLGRLARDGSVTIFGVLGSGDLFGELAYFAGVPRQVDALAESDATLDRIEADRQLSAEQRLIRTLVDMARREGAALVMSQQGLGELIGVSRITAGHLLRRLASSGLIRLEYRRISVPDPDKLAALIGAPQAD